MLEEAGFELSVPRQIANGFEDLSEIAPSAHRGLGIDHGEVDKDCGEPLEAERRQIVQSDRVLRRDAPNRRGLSRLCLLS